MQHLDDGVIQEIIDGEIPSRDLAPLQAHLAQCDACRARLDAARMAASEADELLIMLDEVEPVTAATDPVVLPFRRPHWSRNLAWAASLVLAVGLGYASRDVLNPIVPASPSEQEATGDNGQAIGTAELVGRDTTEPSRLRSSTPTEAAPRDARSDQAMTSMPAPVQPTAREELPPAAPPATRGAGVAGLAEGARQATTGAAELESTRELRTGRRTEAAPPAAFERSESASRLRSLDVADAAKAVVAAREVDLPSAMRLLGGSIKLIDGMVPVRLDAAGEEVMVVYRVFWGELLLSQHRDGERIEWTLTAPPGFPPDSLAVLRGKVRP